jgi:hypothetical protein
MLKAAIGWAFLWIQLNSFSVPHRNVCVYDLLWDERVLIYNLDEENIFFLRTEGLKLYEIAYPAS